MYFKVLWLPGTCLKNYEDKHGLCGEYLLINASILLLFFFLCLDFTVYFKSHQNTSWEWDWMDTLIKCLMME